MNEKELEVLFEKCYEDLKNLEIPVGTAFFRGLNNRKSALGVCRRIYTGMFYIQLSKHILNCSKELIKNVIYHELLHTIRGCFNHGRNFAYYMNYINYKLGVKVEIKNTNKEFSNGIKSNYKIICKKCGKEFYRNRLPKDRTGLTHGQCGGDLEIIKIK